MIEHRAQVLAYLALDGIGVADHAVEVAVVLDPFRRRLRAALRHPGDVVDAVAHQAQIVDDALRWHAELVLDAGRIEHGAAHGIDQGDALIDELRHVLVAGRDQGAETLLGGARGQGTDDVIGLDLRDLDQRQAHGPDDGLEWVELLAQLIGHRRAIRLVVAEERVAEGGAGCVEDDADVVWRGLVDQLAQHAEHAHQGAGGLALGVGQLRQRMIGAKQVAGGIDEDDSVLGHDLVRKRARWRCGNELLTLAWPTGCGASARHPRASVLVSAACSSSPVALARPFSLTEVTKPRVCR